jgi:flavin reductase (DIM6/NTAB) family NADH-FMN oxidoreductase RutF
VAVHFVPISATELAELFGGQTGDDTDKFAHCNWHEGPHGLPILDACDHWFAAAILDRHPLGDHIAFLLDPIEAHTRTPSTNSPSTEPAGSLQATRPNPIEAIRPAATKLPSVAEVQTVVNEGSTAECA